MTHAAGIAYWLRRGALLSLLVACAASARAADEPCAVYVMNVDGSNVRKLAEVPGYSDHTAPRWSHDGQRVVFEVLPAGGGSRKCFIVNADGSELREFGGQAFPSWSPDDKQIAFQAYPAAGQAARSYVQNVDGNGRTEIADGASPRWSPDGARLATTDGHMLRVVDLASGTEANLFPEPYFEMFRGFAWSPDGKRIAVAVRPAQGAGRQLMIVSAEGAAKGLTLRLKIGTSGFVSFSPDGKQLVLAAENKILILDVDGTGKARWVPHQTGKNRSPDWSPDGKRIVFVSDRDAAAGR